MSAGVVTSITHRITGILLAIGAPFSVYLLDRSLRDPQSYAWVAQLFAQAAFKVVALAFIWALAHHLFAGVRHPLSDIDIGSRLPAAQRSAWTVNLCGLAVALLAAGALFRDAPLPACARGWCSVSTVSDLEGDYAAVDQVA